MIRGLDLAEFLELAHPPRAVAVIGAGATGLGLAQTLARLGVAVTVVDRGPALAEWPRELADPALRRIRAEGVRVLEHVEIVEAVPLGAGAKLILSSGERVEAPHLVYAVGWRPATEGLGLETAGVAVGPSGVATRADLRTRARRIYAAGEIVAGAPADAAAAARMGALAARSALLGLKGEARLALEPRFARLDPPIATVGLDETQARAAGIKGLRVLRATLGESETARASGRGEGHVALLIDRRGRLLGAGLVGQGAEAAAPLLAQAIARRLDMAALAALPMPDLDIFAAIARAASVELARLARAPAAARLLKLRRLWR